MASIQRIVSKITGEISYRAQVRVKGHATQGQTFPNKKEAQQWANSIESAIRENRYFPQARAARTLFGEVTKRYRESVLSQMSADEQYTRGQRLEWWEKRFVAKTIAEITPDIIAEARDALANEPFARAKERVNKRTGVVTAPKQYKRSGATINRYLAALSHLFTIAIKEWRLVDRNPVRDVSKKKEGLREIEWVNIAHYLITRPAAYR